MSEKSSSRVTTDHEEIRKWVESKGGRPSRVKGTGNESSLAVDFMDGGELQEISWDEFFKHFDEKRLAFLYQEDEDGNFFKLISRDSAN